MTEYTQDELVAELAVLYGADPMRWAFKCPSCGDVATGQDFSDALKATNADRPFASDHLGQVCIGRVIGALAKDTKYHGRGCDWAAFGLFAGPNFVIQADGRRVPCFPLAPANGPAS